MWSPKNVGRRGGPPGMGLHDAVQSGYRNMLCTEYSGGDDCVTMGNVYNKLGTDSFSMYCWHKHTNGVDRLCIAGKMLSGGNNAGYRMFFDGGFFYVIIRSAAGFAYRRSAGGGYNSGNWCNVGFSYDGSESVTGINMYCNGSLMAMTDLADTLSGTLNNAVPFLISGYHSAATPVNPFDGKLKDLSLWNKELSAGEMAELTYTGKPQNLLQHSAAANLEGWWRQGDAAGDVYPTLVDSSASGNNGTMTGMNSGDIVLDSP